MSAKEQGKYKDTVRLPTTAFPQRGDLVKREPELIARWKAEDLYGRIQAAREHEASFILHDGPPYSNGHIHYGHILNKVLKDLVVKHKTMTGLRAPYIPGWDTHGLPIELAVERELGAKRAGMSQADVRAACKAYAMKFVEIQRREFERLGVFGDWSHPYLTLSPVYEQAIVKALAAFARDLDALLSAALPAALLPLLVVRGNEGSWVASAASSVLEHPPRMLVVTFLVLCFGGAVLLALPASTESGVPISIVDAAFTAVSAVCVTRPAVVPRYTSWPAVRPLACVLMPSVYTVASWPLVTAASTKPSAGLPALLPSALRARMVPASFHRFTESPAARFSLAGAICVSAPMPTGIMLLSSRPVASSAGILSASAAPVLACTPRISCSRPPTRRRKV